MTPSDAILHAYVALLVNSLTAIAMATNYWPAYRKEFGYHLLRVGALRDELVREQCVFLEFKRGM